MFSQIAFSKDTKTHKDCFITPCEIKGDFDGDKKIDVATLVVDKKGRKGVQITFSNKRTVVLGAGASFGNGGDNFDWMDRWSLHKGNFEQGATTSKKPPAAKGDSLLLEKVESASGIAYWNGSKFNWYQQGD